MRQCRRPPRVAQLSKATTVIECGSNCRMTLPPEPDSTNGLGATVAGDSKELTLLTLGEESISPAACLTPAAMTSTFTVRLGSTLVSASQSLPFFALAAIASTRGRDMFPYT